MDANSGITLGFVMGCITIIIMVVLLAFIEDKDRTRICKLSCQPLIGVISDMEIGNNDDNYLQEVCICAQKVEPKAEKE